MRKEKSWKHLIKTKSKGHSLNTIHEHCQITVNDLHAGEEGLVSLCFLSYLHILNSLKIFFTSRFQGPKKFLDFNNLQTSNYFFTEIEWHQIDLS